MDDSLDETARWASAAAAASPDEDELDTGAQAADPFLGPIGSEPIEALSTRSAPAFAAGLLRYCPHATLAAWLLGVAWLMGSSFADPPRTVAQQEGAQSAETGHTAQKADVEAMRATQSPSMKDVTDLGIAKPRLGAAKTEASAAIAEAPSKAERPRSKSAEKLSKASDRLDRIGLEIAALLAAAPSVGRSGAVAAPVTQRRPQDARHDAFDPLQNPSAPGVPRPLGTIARSASAANSAENEYGQRAN
ncbi:MAG: hypothetical protein JO223_19615 [Hyphomicrobiales bacterium]|nr:hypothetical protein [Hyphomicrobiales bacterium]MBV8440933.1 hypothetical protein [Hyphomicrobiales bacterium]